MIRFFRAIGSRLQCILRLGMQSFKVRAPRSTRFSARLEALEYRQLMAGLGLSATYFDNMDFTGQTVSKVTPSINFNWAAGSPDARIAADTFSARFEGNLKIPITGSYNFRTVSDDGVRLWINGQLVINNWTNHSATTNTSAAIALTAGQPVSIRLEYYENTGTAQIALTWKRPGQTNYALIPEAQLTPTLSRPALLNFSGRHFTSSWSESIFTPANLAVVKKAPFDGLVVGSYAGNFLFQPAQPDLASPFVADNASNNEFDIRDNPVNFGTFDLTKLSGTTLQHNFALLNAYRPGDFFDNAAWDGVAAEVAAFASVAKAKGFEGIFFDNEDYASNGPLSLYRWENRTDLSKTPQQYITQARVRGQQIMQAIVGVWPDVKLIAAHGIAELSGPDVVAYGLPEPENIAAHTAAAFTAGIWQGRGALATFIDGGEFGYETEQWYGSGTNPGSVVVGAPNVGFDAAYRNNRFNYPLNGEYARTDLQTLPAPGGGTYQVQHYEILPASFSQEYSNSVVQALATYDQFEWSQNRASPVLRTAAQTLNQNTLAVARADQYVWHYTDRYDFLVTPGIVYPRNNPENIVSVAPSAATVEAIRLARETGNQRIPASQLVCYSFDAPLDVSNWMPVTGNWSVANTTRSGVVTKAYVQGYSTNWGVSTVAGDASAGGTQTLTNYSISAAVRTENGVVGAWGEYGAGVIGRYVDQNNYYGLVIRNTGLAREWVLFARVNGINQWISGGQLSWSPGDWVYLQLQMKGNSIVARSSTDGVNFNTLTTATDNRFSSGKYGLVGYWAKTSFDDVKITF